MTALCFDSSIIPTPPSCAERIQRSARLACIGAASLSLMDPEIDTWLARFQKLGGSGGSGAGLPSDVTRRQPCLRFDVLAATRGTRHRSLLRDLRRRPR